MHKLAIFKFKLSVVPFNVTNDGKFTIYNKSRWFHFLLSVASIVVYLTVCPTLFYTFSQSIPQYIRYFTVFTIIFKHVTMTLSAIYFLIYCPSLCSILNNSVSISNDLGFPNHFRYILSNKCLHSYGIVLLIGMLGHIKIIISEYPFNDLVYIVAITTVIVLNYLSFFIEFNFGAFIVNSKATFSMFNLAFSNEHRFKQVQRAPSILLGKWCDVDLRVRQFFVPFTNFYVLVVFFYTIGHCVFEFLVTTSLSDLFWTTVIVWKLSAILALTTAAFREVNFSYNQIRLGWCSWWK